MTSPPRTRRERRVAELQSAEAALYEKLAGEERIIARLYRQGKTQEALVREDMWLADLQLYELTVDERRELERA
jgi:Ser/Thr protein kinase RdoA (MazF antagonist)